MCVLASASSEPNQLINSIPNRWAWSFLIGTKKQFRKTFVRSGGYTTFSFWRIQFLLFLWSDKLVFPSFILGRIGKGHHWTIIVCECLKCQSIIIRSLFCHWRLRLCILFKRSTVTQFEMASDSEIGDFTWTNLFLVSSEAGWRIPECKFSQNGWWKVGRIIACICIWGICTESSSKFWVRKRKSLILIHI